MAATIPTVQPTHIVAGDTATWKISLGDFSAAEGWTLTYSLLRRTGGVRILITATASSTSHLVSESATTTAAWLPGVYDVQGYVTKTGERHLVWTGQIEILPNYAVAEDGMETRTIARKTLDALEAAILKIATAQQTGTAGGITEWQAEGLRIKRASTELLVKEMTAQRDRYAAIVRNEDMRAARLAGRATGQKVLIRFTG